MRELATVALMLMGPVTSSTPVDASFHHFQPVKTEVALPPMI
jgi:hypothetical protein